MFLLYNGRYSAIGFLGLENFGSGQILGNTLYAAKQPNLFFRWIQNLKPPCLALRPLVSVLIELIVF